MDEGQDIVCPEYLNALEPLLAGGFENWLTIARSFAASIEEKADLIHNDFLQGQYKDYTIQVHALKSAARIVGAEGLSKAAANLEDKGNTLQKMLSAKADDKAQALISQMKAETDEMLELYCTYINLLAPVKKYGQKAESEKDELSSDEISEIVKSLLQACEDYNLVKVEEEFSRLQKARLPENLAGKMEELSKAVEDIEFEQIEDILKTEDILK